MSYLLIGEVNHPQLYVQFSCQVYTQERKKYLSVGEP